MHQRGRTDKKLGITMPNSRRSAPTRVSLAAKIIRGALGIESDDVANYCFPKTWPADRERRARIIGDWLQTEARFLA
jgi:hypothetical protein